MSKVVFLTLANITLINSNVRSHNRFTEMIALNPILITLEKLAHYGAYNKGCHGCSIRGFWRISLASGFSGAGHDVIYNEKYKLPVTKLSNKYAATVTLG